MENGGHFGRHLEFRRELQGDSWGLLVCCSTHIPGRILKNSACYELFIAYIYLMFLDYTITLVLHFPVLLVVLYCQVLHFQSTRI